MIYNKERVLKRYNELLKQKKVLLLDTKEQIWDISPNVVKECVFLDDRIEFILKYNGKLRHIVVLAKSFESLDWDYQENDPRYEDEDDGWD